MFKKIKHLKSATKVGLYWTRACDLASKKRYLEALGYINKIEAITDGLPDVSLLKGLLNLRLERYEECTSIMLRAVEQIAGYEKYSSSDKRYLKAYAALCYQRAARMLGMKDYKRLDFQSQDIAVKNVKPELRNTFPFKDVRGSRR